MSTKWTRAEVRMMLAEILLEPAGRDTFERWADRTGFPRKTLFAVARGLGIDVDSPVWRVPENVVPIRRLLAA
jgi:hypothetical protein